MVDADVEAAGGGDTSAGFEAGAGVDADDDPNENGLAGFELEAAGD